MKNAVFWDDAIVVLVGTDVSEETHLLVTVNIISSLPILFTLMMEAICSSETWVLIRATRRHIPEYVIL
jgi:hypothetical protein